MPRNAKTRKPRGGKKRATTEKMIKKVVNKMVIPEKQSATTQIYSGIVSTYIQPIQITPLFSDPFLDVTGQMSQFTSRPSIVLDSVDNGLLNTYIGVNNNAHISRQMTTINADRHTGTVMLQVNNDTAGNFLGDCLHRHILLAYDGEPPPNITWLQGLFEYNNPTNTLEISCWVNAKTRKNNSKYKVLWDKIFTATHPSSNVGGSIVLSDSRQNTNDLKGNRVEIHGNTIVMHYDVKRKVSTNIDAKLIAPNPQLLGFTYVLLSIVKELTSTGTTRQYALNLEHNTHLVASGDTRKMTAY